MRIGHALYYIHFICIIKTLLPCCPSSPLPCCPSSPLPCCPSSPPPLLPLLFPLPKVPLIQTIAGVYRSIHFHRNAAHYTFLAATQAIEVASRCSSSQLHFFTVCLCVRVSVCVHVHSHRHVLYVCWATSNPAPCPTPCPGLLPANEEPLRVPDESGPRGQPRE